VGRRLYSYCTWWALALGVGGPGFRDPGLDLGTGDHVVAPIALVGDRVLPDHAAGRFGDDLDCCPICRLERQALISCRWAQRELRSHIAAVQRDPSPMTGRRSLAAVTATRASRPPEITSARQT